MADGSPNPYIRTFFKDMDAASKKPPEPAAESPAPAGDAREAVLARLKNRAQSQSPAPAAPAVSEPITVPEPTPHKQVPGVSIFVTPAAKPTTALPEHPLELPAHTLTTEAAPPVPLPPSPVPAPAPAQAPAAAPLPVTPPAPKAPPEPVKFVRPEEAIPPRITEPTFTTIPPVPQPPIEPPPPPKAPPPAPAPSPIHTYSSDFADRVDKKNASTFSVLAAESDQGTAPKAVRFKKPSMGLVMTVAGVVLVAGGATGLYFAYRYVTTHQSVPLAPQIASLVFAEDREALTGTGPELLTAIAASAGRELAAGQVRVLYLTQSTTTPEGVPVTLPLAGGELIGALNLAAPNMLLRNIAPESTVGIVHAGNESRAFFILRVLSYERTFAGMLEWEGSMQGALATLYPSYPAPAPPPPTIATTTKTVNGKQVVATTTIEAPPVFVAPPRFVDEVASNHDVRALKDSQGRTILLYGYKDKETLIIARDEDAFAELIRRLSATKQQ